LLFFASAKPKRRESAALQMAIRISNLRLDLDEPESALPEHLAKLFGVAPPQLGRWRILRKSLDARIKRSVHFVYTAEICPSQDEDRLLRIGRRRKGDVRVERHAEPEFHLPAPGTARLDAQPVIVGSGPAGLVAGYFLAER